MMSTIVAKAFNSTQRHFREGDPVSILDDLSPHTFADLKDRGFIASKRDAAPVEVPERTPRKK